jgi:pantothenate kinase
MTGQPPIVDRSDHEVLIGRARELIASGSRRLLGITGAPGAGKSTLAEEIVDALAPEAVLVPMDGFHLAEAPLHRLGRHDRKGAPDTFDAGGYIALLRRLRTNAEDVIYAPTFRRDIEEPIAGAIAVPRGLPLVVTEGNYLLVDEHPWAPVRELLDEVWFVELPEQVRLDRLIKRHMTFGRDIETAQARAGGSDQRNAQLVANTKARADLVIVG